MYSLSTRYINGVAQQSSYNVFVNGHNVGRFTGGCFYPDNVVTITVNLMEFLVREYRLSLKD